MEVLHAQVTVDLLNFLAFTLLLFSFQSNLCISVIWRIIITITHKLISWTLVLEIDNYKGIKGCGFLN